MTDQVAPAVEEKRRRHRKPPLSVLPPTGHVRLRDILAHLPIGRSTWWRWVREGKVPQPIKLSEQVCLWRAEDVHKLIRDRAAASSQREPAAAAPAA